MAMPDINPDKVCHIVVLAREFDAQEDQVEDDSGSNPADENFREVLAASPDDPTYDELKAYIDGLDIDEQCELVALAWVGRGDFSAAEWTEAVRTARSRHTGNTADYLLGVPQLPDLLEEGLAAFELSCESFERRYL